MSWLHDPLTGRTVRIAPGREARPNDFSDGQSAKRCPFCAGAEADTPAEVDRIEDPDGHWLARVVPNAYPVVIGDDGSHEVVIESPRHVRRFVDLTDAEASAAVEAWARGVERHRSRPQIGYVLLFKNEGSAAGASLEHVHSQLVALSEPPKSFAITPETYAQRPAEAGTTVGEFDGFAVSVPPAPRTPNEVWLAPVDRWALSEQPSAIAGALSRVLRTLDASAFNLALQVPPLGQDAGADWWRLEVIPRDGAIAGFELATGAFISSLAPERAIEALRERFAEL